MKIGLAFPELNTHKMEDFINLLTQNNHKLDLVIFPEGFETIKPNQDIKPEEIKNNEEFNIIIDKYSDICRNFSISIILGIQVKCHTEARNGGNSDQYCLIIKPDGKYHIYHKHSTSRFKAIFDTNWSIENNFPVITV